MSYLVNIYNDEQSAIIIDETSTDVVSIKQYPTLGSTPFQSIDNINLAATANMYFVELQIMDENEKKILTLNSAKPLLKNTSTGKFYFGPMHYHTPTSTYMIGEKHINEPHQSLEVVRQNQFVPYPLESRMIQGQVSTTLKKFALKTSEIFEVLSNLETFNLSKDTKFFLQYGVFQDVFLQLRQAVQSNQGTGQQGGSN